MADLRDLDDVDRLACYHASSWFETCRTILVIIKETLSLNDIIYDDETTYSGGSCVIYGADLSTYHRKRHRYDQIYYFMVSFFLVMSFFLYNSCNIILVNYHVDFNIILHVCPFILILNKYNLKSLIYR